MDKPFKVLFENAAIGLMVLDLEGRILDYNSAARRLLGRERGAVFERPLHSFLRPPYDGSFPEQLRHLQQLGHLTVEAAFAGPRGAQVLIDLSLVPWGDAEAAFAVAREVTHRESLEQELALQRLAMRAEEPRRAYFLALPDGTMKAYPFREPGAQAPAHLDFVRELFGTPRLQEALARARAGERLDLPPGWYAPPVAVESDDGRTGSELLLRLSFLPMPDALAVWGIQGSERLVLVVAEDRTEARLDAERQRERDQRAALSLFSEALLHELNNFLGVILAQASSMRLSTPAGQLSPPAIGAILDAAQEAVVLLRRGSEVGQDRGGRWTSFDLNACLKEAARLLGRMAGPGVRVVLDTQEGLPEVRGDSDLLGSIVVGLARQAEARMPAGGQVTLRSFRVESPGAGAAGVGFTVEDTGIALDPMTRKQVLDALVPAVADGSVDPMELAFARAVVRHHRGKLDLEAPAGGGTRWRVTLPGKEARPRLTGPLPTMSVLPDDEQIEQQIEEAAQRAADRSARNSTLSSPVVAAPAADGKRPCVLVADDEENFLDFSGEMLKQAGYDVVLAQDGQMAYEQFQKDPDRFVLTVLDAYMPRLGGLECYLRMQALRPDLPVLFVSGFARGPSLEALVKACPGRVEVILKPFAGDEFVEKVGRMLGRMRPRS